MAPKRARRALDADEEEEREDQPLALDDALPPVAAAQEEETEEDDPVEGEAAAEQDEEGRRRTRQAAAAGAAAAATAPAAAGGGVARRQAMANAARRRAAHFAHFDPDNDQLVGPRPNRRRRRRGEEGDDEGGGGEDDDEEEDDDDNPHTGGAAADARQLGPWASAAQLDRARGRAAVRRAAKLREAALEGVKAAREAAQLWRPRAPPAGDLAAAANAANAPQQQQQHPSQPVAAPAAAVPRLTSLALRVIADHIADVETLWGLPCALRHAIAAELARSRALTEAASFLLAQDLPPELVLPDCTQTDARAAQRLAREAASPALERLDLGFCGRGFGDEAVGAGGFARGGRGSLPRLREVRLSGAYRLSDAGVVALLEAAAASPEAAGGSEGPRSAAAAGRGKGGEAAAEAGGEGGGGGDGGGEFDYEGGAAFAAALAGGDGGDAPRDSQDQQRQGEGSEQGAGGGLQSLSLPQCPRLEGPFLRRLPDLAPRLRALDLTECRGLSGAALRHALPRLPHLAALALDGVPEADEALVVEAVAGGGAARAGRLRELSLRGCAAACTDAALAALAACPSAPGLEVLRLDECHAFSDAGLEALAGGLKALRELSLRRCSPALSDAALAALVSRAAAGTIRRANFAGLAGAGPLLAAALARSGAAALEALDLSFCRALPEEGLGLVADACPQLSELRVFGCSQITRKFLHGHSNARLASGEGLLSREDGAGAGVLGAGVGGANAHGGVVGVGTFVVHA